MLGVNLVPAPNPRDVQRKLRETTGRLSRRNVVPGDVPDEPLAASQDDVARAFDDLLEESD